MSKKIFRHKKIKYNRVIHKILMAYLFLSPSFSPFLFYFLFFVFFALFCMSLEYRVFFFFFG